MSQEDEPFVISLCPTCDQFLEADVIDLDDGQCAYFSNKDYLKWSFLKGKLNNTPSTRARFHEREIWACNLGENIGFEQDGKGSAYMRPVLIIRKFNHEIVWAIPLTTTKKEDNPYYFNFSFQKNTNSAAILSQIRLIDAKRLSHLVGYMNKEDFKEIKKKLKELLP